MIGLVFGMAAKNDEKEGLFMQQHATRDFM